MKNFLHFKITSTLKTVLKNTLNFNISCIFIYTYILLFVTEFLTELWILRISEDSNVQSQYLLNEEQIWQLFKINVKVQCGLNHSYAWPET